MRLKTVHIIVRRDTNEVLSKDLSWVKRDCDFKFKIFKGKQASSTRTYLNAHFETKKLLKIETIKIQEIPYKRLLQMDIDEWFDIYKENVNVKNHYVLEYNNKKYNIKLTSDRYLNFYHNGVVCKHCGLEGLYFWVENNTTQTSNYHLNLYGLDKHGREIMLTKDHILPKSKGGEDKLENFQVLCENCNVKKGNTLEEDLCR
jgi:5-methylcytosine-specific restriction endonuclease McrA